MREGKEREDKIKFSRGGFLFVSSSFPQCEKFCCVWERNNLTSFFQSARSVSIPVLFYCGPTYGWELRLLKLVFLFLWCSWYGYTLLLHVQVLLFGYFSPLEIEIISALCFTNPHASRYAFLYQAVRGLFSFYLVPDLFITSCVVRIQSSCFTCFLDNFAVYINKIFLAAGAVG